MDPKAVNDSHPAISTIASGVSIRLKVVPGASRTKVSGLLGDRLKVAVAAAPEAGKANQAVISLISKALDIPERRITVTHGHANPLKTIEVQGATMEQALAALGLKP